MLFDRRLRGPAPAAAVAVADADDSIAMSTQRPASAAPAQPRSRRILGWAGSVLLLVSVLYLLFSMATSPSLHWDRIGFYLFSQSILSGVGMTIVLAIVSQVLSTIVGFVAASMRSSRNVILSTLAAAYIAAFRATPLLVQILLWYNLALFIPNLQLGIPFTDVVFVSVPTNDVLGPFAAALIGLSLAEGAYMAEIIRSGLLSVPRGQWDASLSLGMTRTQAFWRIIVPEAVRVMLPTAGNQFINVIKATALVSVVGGGDLLTRAQSIYSTNYLVVPLLIVATIWYVTLTVAATLLQVFIERRLDVNRASSYRSWSAELFRRRTPVIARRATDAGGSI